MDNITNHSEQILNELNGVINLDTKKQVISQYTDREVIDAVTKYVLQRFNCDNIFETIVEETFKNKFGWVSDSYDREFIFEFL
jgi:hypothetical protein